MDNIILFTYLILEGVNPWRVWIPGATASAFLYPLAGVRVLLATLLFVPTFVLLTINGSFFLVLCRVWLIPGTSAKRDSSNRTCHHI